MGGGAYELVLKRHHITFAAGQLVTLHGRTVTEDRDYSIASGTPDEHLQILYRHIPNGRLTSHLVQRQAGDILDITGPYGRFVVRDPARPLVFVATGTGIAPCRSYVRSHAGLDLTVIHGVPDRDALHYAGEFGSTNYRPCLSRETCPDFFHGRVTEFVRSQSFPPEAHFYLCGAFEMICEVSEMLEERGCDPECIFTETYYFGTET